MKYNGCIPDIVTYETIIGYLSKWWETGQINFYSKWLPKV
jgi:hypothetical protein